jgi:Zn-dependent protease
MNETESGDKAYRVIETDGEKYVMSYAAGWYGDELYKASSGLYYYKVPLISGTSISGTAVVSGADAVIQPAFGKVVSVLYQMLCRCMLVNITLAVFNLIPLPPLDGYHVLNDLVLHQDLFAQKRTQQIASMVLIGLIMLGNVNPDWDIIGKILEFIQVNLIGSFTTITKLLAQSMGLV